MIAFALANPDEFKVIRNNIVIEDEENVRDKFLLRTSMMSSLISELQRDKFYSELYGWITSNSLYKWKDSKIASFSKQDFDNKLILTNSSPSIINAIFRTKNEFGTIDTSKIEETRKELFVKQIEDIKRNKAATERKIKDAIQDYIYSDIEIKVIVETGNYTSEDFDKFRDACRLKWQECYDSNVLKELDEYNEDEKHEIAIHIFDTIMNEVEVKFNESFAFTTNNKYIKNGSFLKLSNKPEIGWHPEWETKYKNFYEAK